MRKETLHQPLEIIYEKVTSCPLNNRGLNFLEFAYIISGSGYYTLNDNTIFFKSKQLFMVTPNDCHGFDLHGECEFLVIRVDKSYLNEYQWKSIDHIECLLFNRSNIIGSIISDERDKKTVDSLITNLLSCIEGDALYYQDLKKHLTNAIIVLAARNISLFMPKGITSSPDKKIVDIISFIQHNIQNPSVLKIAALSERFGCSESYFSNYFKRNCGESLQEYVSSYRIRLIEHRLKYSDARINEIVSEFGFSDESHINKFFKKHKKVSLSRYRSDHLIKKNVKN
ncbi:AraC family transcriptional regulator [Chryseobacterium shigense]|uniref:AraC-type DNA-binding protein n=1 Tax=Chryseobacterium shigense TaxID=297244 RepID=A0A1N7I8C1_9FLAO|nr:AraC family transcriptional regulator [Chryseobacterium shigense]PQA96980.1 AraC family transcriptional regulator [Chryseobacterium shigense]SIS33324.1 AraC-type DNA-binding protein [Chryseobacterium shigense]